MDSERFLLVGHWGETLPYFLDRMNSALRPDVTELASITILGINIISGIMLLRRMKKQSIVDGIRNEDF